jgi:uncharacterized damage-inducible protein DinB
MLSLFQQLLISQFEASLAMLSHCVARCPEDRWQIPVARYPFSQVVFHTLFYTDFYLGKQPDDFQMQAFHRENKTLFGQYEQLEDREPVEVYDRGDIQRYLAFCRTKAATIVQAETEQSLAAPAAFPRRRCSRAETHVYNIRHIQHHVGQLSMRLRLEGGVDFPWIDHGWREPELSSPAV